MIHTAAPRLSQVARSLGSRPLQSIHTTAVSTRGPILVRDGALETEIHAPSSGTSAENTRYAPPSAVVDSRYVVHVVYGTSTMDTGVWDPDIHYVYSTSASTWSTRRTMDSSSGGTVVKYPTISLDSSTGNVYAMWIRDGTSADSITVQKNVTGSWSTVSPAQTTYVQDLPHVDILRSRRGVHLLAVDSEHDIPYDCAIRQDPGVLRCCPAGPVRPDDLHRRLSQAVQAGRAGVRMIRLRVQPFQSLNNGDAISCR